MKQHWIFNLMSEARDQTHIFMDTVGFLTHWAKWELPDPGFMSSFLKAAYKETARMSQLFS